MIPSEAARSEKPVLDADRAMGTGFSLREASGDGHRFPAGAKLRLGPLSWTDASAGGGTAEKIMLNQ
jgi:hypothetical protein